MHSGNYRALWVLTSLYLECFPSRAILVLFQPAFFFARHFNPKPRPEPLNSQRMDPSSWSLEVFCRPPPPILPLAYPNCLAEASLQWPKSRVRLGCELRGIELKGLRFQGLGSRFYCLKFAGRQFRASRSNALEGLSDGRASES